MISLNLNRYKKKLYVVLILLNIGISFLHGQSSYQFKGLVLDENKDALIGATVYLLKDSIGVSTDINGVFEFSNLKYDFVEFEISFIGYETIHEAVFLKANKNYLYQLKKTEVEIGEVEISHNHLKSNKEENALDVQQVDKEYLRQNIGGSLMQSLEKIPGVSTMDIGSGQSKPVIRGLSFNRILVVENNIKHEAQQWGADHGLEIDQYAVDNIEIIKGPASLAYGSDAIGGVVNIENKFVPEKNSYGITTDLTGKTNNGSLGASLFGFFRKESFFLTARTTLLYYGDYRVPTDSVDIYNYRVPLYKNQVRNTAGQEQNFHTSFGYIKKRFQSKMFVSFVNSKNGFFANAHGLEPRSVDEEFHDASARDIQYPYQKVNHLKILNNTSFLKDKWSLKFDVGFQRNFREEWSQYVQHGFMPAVAPENLDFNPEIERQFTKYIYTGNAKFNYYLSSRTEFDFGLSTEYVDNDISGRGFIIPAYKQYNLGGFAIAKHHFSKKSLLQVGVRYDYGHLHTFSYQDWFLSPLEENGITSYEYLERAEEIKRNFSNLSWSVGFNYNPNKWSYKINIGKSFRMPIAKELAANGVNYHRFSYEVGDANLSPESSYQLDLGVAFNAKKFAINLSPFVNYFSNYIYLNPTSNYDRLYGFGNQVFEYSESKVLRLGSEVSIYYDFIKNFELSFIGEYLYAQQLSGEKKGYTLPFSPPATGIFSLKYQLPKLSFLSDMYASVDYKFTAAQNRIVPPEEKTAAYHLLSARLGGEINIKKQKILVSMQLNNILNTKYFDHTSYYRLINVPGLGRNFVCNISIPITGKIKKK